MDAPSSCAGAGLMMGKTHVARHAQRMVSDTVQFPLLASKLLWLIPMSLVSISHRKAPPNMIRFLHFIDHRHRIVLDRDAALPSGILEQAVRAKAESSGSLAGKNVGRW